MENKKYIALTFDDGPNRAVTPVVLEKLRKYGIVATFFVVGRNITEENAPVMQEAFDMGCEIENHSQNHLHMDKISKEEILDEIKKTDDLIEKYTGKKPSFFRPPFIDVNNLMHEIIEHTFISGICPNDWDQKVTTEETAKGVIETAKDGGIILLHDSDYNLKTALALDEIIPTLLDDGYEFVTISKLFEIFNKSNKKGTVYHNIND
ncbi:MAG: polysaccharide deacetylase family protein [Clostridia bacterium]|nr:polysaccharide deacetylase family protein [Clostridia bacterium]